MSQTIFDDFDGILKALSRGDSSKVWKHFISIQTDLSFDDNIKQEEKECLAYLDKNISKAISQKTSSEIGSKLNSLRESIEQRATPLPESL